VYDSRALDHMIATGSIGWVTKPSNMDLKL
jgi:hypothetical protein